MSRHSSVVYFYKSFCCYFLPYISNAVLLYYAFLELSCLWVNLHLLTYFLNELRFVYVALLCLLAFIISIFVIFCPICPKFSMLGFLCAFELASNNVNDILLIKLYSIITSSYNWLKHIFDLIIYPRFNKCSNKIHSTLLPNVCQKYQIICRCQIRFLSIIHLLCSANLHQILHFGQLYNSVLLQ